MNVKPDIKSTDKKLKICFLCEGEEEVSYIKRLTELDVWSKQYSFQALNAKGISNLFRQYQSKYQNQRYDLVLIFCDTETDPYQDFTKLREQVNSLHGRKVCDKVIIFANPCSLQIILQHFGNVKLNTADKSKNENLIKRLTGVEEYRATENQRNKICSKINQENYVLMKNRVGKFSKEYVEPGSSNFSEWTVFFETESSNWIKKINKELEK